MYRTSQFESKNFIEMINPKKNIIIGCRYKHLSMNVFDFKNKYLYQSHREERVVITNF